MKKLICIIAVISCLTMSICGGALAAPAEDAAFGGGVQVSGLDVTVWVTLETEGVHSAQLTVSYDPESVALVSATAGESVQNADVISLDTDTDGEVAFGFASIQALEPGSVLELRFRGLITGKVEFNVDVAEYEVGVDEGVNTDGLEYVIVAKGLIGDEDDTSTPEEPDTGVTTGDKTEDGTTTTETTATPDATVKDGEASVTVTDAMGDEIVMQAEANDSDSVVIAPEVTGDVTKAEVTVPGDTVKDLGDKTDADLRIETPVADVTIPNEALSGLGKDGDVTVTVEKKNEGVSVTVSVDDEVVETVPGGLKVAVELGDGQVAVLVGDDGTETVIPKSIVENGVTYVILEGSGTVKIADNDKDFADVKSTDWFNANVDFVTSHELFNGTSATTFEPYTVMSRAMVATVLWRLESEAKAGAAATFPDVDADQWYTDAVAWASENEIVLGKGDGKFGTNDPVTRQELAIMLSRYAKLMGIDTSAKASLSGFTDGANTDTWAKDDVMWAVSAGLLQGKDGNKLDPTGTATRAEVATILQRMVGLLVK